MEAVILNDTRAGGHPGCVLVMRQLLQGCRAAGIEVIRTLPLRRDFCSLSKQEILRADIVIINGEGTLHHDMPGALALMDAGLFAHAHGKPVALINTVWEKNKRANELLACTTLRYARESLSAFEIQQAGFDAKVVPDLVMTCSADLLYRKPANALGPVIVMDDVRWDKALMLARYAKLNGLEFYRMAPRPPLHSFGALAKWGALWIAGGWRSQFGLDDINVVREASLVVTGRFHGVCLSILAQRPFVAISSNTHKIEGLLIDAQLGDCATLVKDSILEPAPFRQIDEALVQVRSASQQSDLLKLYQESCLRYTEKACNETALMFAAIATLGREGKSGA